VVRSLNEERIMDQRYTGVVTRTLRDEERRVPTTEQQTPLVIEPLHARDATFLAEFLASHSSELIEDIARHGAVLVRGFDVTSPADFERQVLSIRGMQGMNEVLMSEEGRTVVDGTLVSPGHGPEIINDSKFEDFKLHVEFNCGAGANSGVYLRGRYEVQIEDNSTQEPPSHHTGGVYGFLAPTPEMPRKPGEWQTFDITLIGRMITVVQNGKTIIDNQEIPGITGGALDSHEELPGPIYLQGSEDGHVAFRKITVTPTMK